MLSCPLPNNEAQIWLKWTQENIDKIYLFLDSSSNTIVFNHESWLEHTKSPGYTYLDIKLWY